MSEPTSTPPSPAAASAEIFDPQRRRLCADGSCVGIVGPDGRCRICGTAHPDGPGDGPGFVPLTTAEDDAPYGDDAVDADIDIDIGFPLAAGGDGEGFVPGRGLCPDGSCVGVLGADGRCKVCGRAGETGA